MVRWISQAVVFVTLQGIFWLLVIRAWLQLREKFHRPRLIRQWLGCGSLICSSIALVFTAGMTIYGWWWQPYYGRLEFGYVVCTIWISFLGIVLGIAGKRSPRLIALFTSIFTLLVAILDAVAKRAKETSGKPAIQKLSGGRPQ